ncbi:hypothetical protein AB0L13_37020 [Saccharopolyspora shandongensis]|uniref:hypothetical protein n=1 Tax=Saccharopolyspora shandongensis TaxID=418495 RepID=UPI00343B7F2D
MGSTSWWTRADSRVLEAVIGLGLLLVGLFGVLFPVLGVTGPLPPVDTREVRLAGAAQLPGIPGAVALRGTDHAELVFAAPGFADRLLLVLPELVGNLLLVAILSILLQVARTFRGGDLFAPRNAPRLLAIAIALPLRGFLVPLADMVTTDLLAAGTPAENAIRVVAEFDLTSLFLGLLVAAAAVAFRNGARLRADTEGLV